MDNKMKGKDVGSHPLIGGLFDVLGTPGKKKIPPGQNPTGLVIKSSLA
jgi:hypothetical protein